MVVLLGIAFAAGVITAVSPCVLPVLPIVLAGGASGSGRRPYAIVAGLLAMFVVSILFASWVLRKLGLPQDLLRNVAIALLFAVAAPLRARMAQIRPVLGVVIAGAALALVFNVDTKLQTSLPNWTDFLQRHTENTAFTRGKLYKQRRAAQVSNGLPDYGTAPDIH